MQTVGEMLRLRRIERHLSFEDVEKAIKIRIRFLKAIESDDYNKLPSRAYAEGFVKTYGKYLGLKERDIIAFFRRQLSEPAKASILPKKSDSILNTSAFRLTPSRFLAILLFGFVCLFTAYFVIQYRAFNLPPKLIIEKPLDPETISSQERTEIIGVTDPDATVTVQGISVLVRDDGKFFYQVPLKEGKNMITIVATSRLGNSTSQTRSISYNSE